MSVRIRVQIEGPEPYLSRVLPAGVSMAQGPRDEVPLDIELDALFHRLQLGSSRIGTSDEHALYNRAQSSRRTLIVYMRPYPPSTGAADENDQLVIAPAGTECMGADSATVSIPPVDFSELTEYDFPLYNAWMVRITDDDEDASPSFILLSGIRAWPFAWFGNFHTGDLTFIDEVADAPGLGVWNA